VIAGNWKMNMLPEEAVTLVRGIWQEIEGHDKVEAVVCPPFVDIPAVSELIRNAGMAVGLGAQNMHWEESGAYTGEVSPLMLKKFEVTHVIIGHSERRQFFGETDQGVNRKVKAALAHGFIPIMCCGETLKQREAGETESVVVNQVKCGLFELDTEGARSVIIAYEPIWAIGTGKAATADDADEVCGIIREVVSRDFGDEIAQAVRIQYGGSVTPDNISELMSRENVDGALVGGASLKPDVFAGIVRYS
jgi:triosephosphate isomerase